MISKELLSEVVGYTVNDFIIKDNLLKLDPMYSLAMSNNHKILGYRKSINIYELAHKCKEWAINKGYELKSSKPIVPNDEGKQVFNYWWMAWLFKFDGGYEAPKQVLLPSFTGGNEPEAIFKACQWILGNKGTN